MFAKIFEQIFDSSIAEDWQVRHVFEDLLKLCDREGVIDRTPEAIARRANMPLEIVTRALAALEQPDPHSRSAEYEGRRIVRLHEHRNWGWRIVNYERYRAVASDDQRRSKNLEAVHRYRDQRRAAGAQGSAPPISPAISTSALPSPVISRHPPSRLSCHAEAEAEAEADAKLDRPLSVRERPIGEKPPPEPVKPTKPSKLSIPEKDLADRIEAALGDQWVNDAGKWIGRIRAHFRKAQRVIAELENARKEARIASGPAQYAEDTWKRFA